MSSEQDRRRFHRFPFHADCELQVDQGPATPCELLDLSINGALVELDDAADFDSASSGDLTLRLHGLAADSRADIVVRVRALRIETHRIACRFVEVDPDNFERIRDLVAENLGDVTLLDRELTQLDYWPGLSVTPGGS